MPYESKTVSPLDVEEFLHDARTRYDHALAVDKLDRDEAVDDVQFAAATPNVLGGSSQWALTAIAQRVAAKRPILTENRLPTFIAQVVNDGRQNKPAIKITPMGGGTKETGEMLQDRIRHVEYESDADTVYDTARKQQITCGRAAIRVTTRYKNQESREQEPRLERIANQFSVVWGPHREYDASDAEYCFVVTNISRAEHNRKYGANTLANQNNFWASSQECPAPEWFGAGEGADVQIAEYWLKKHTKRKRVQMQDGQTRYQDEGAPELVDQAIEPWECDDVTVCQYIINGAEILDETTFPVPHIGIVPEWGDEQVVDGARRTYSLIRQAKDPQRLINLYVSNIAEMIALAPKTPYKAPVGAIAGFEQIWEEINTQARAVAPYNEWDEQGRHISAPERETSEPPIQALVLGYNQAVDALKASMGMFDASLGAKSNETAGIAIERRQKESDNANFHFMDNEARTRRAIGRILLALIKVLDRGEKEVAVRSEDGKTRMVKVNTPQPYHDDVTGQMVHHQIELGEYAVSTGRSYASARKEAFDTYSQIAQADPRFMQLAGDILFRNLDAPGNEEIADRYEKTLPPELRPQKGQQPIPPEVQQAMTQLQQQLQQTESFAQSLHAQLVTKQAELDTKREIVEMQEETKRTIAFAQLSQTDGVTMLRADIARIEAALDRQHQKQAQASDQQHQADQATQDRQHQADQATQAQQAQQQQQQPEAAQ